MAVLSINYKFSILNSTYCWSDVCNKALHLKNQQQQQHVFFTPEKCSKKIEMLESIALLKVYILVKDHKWVKEK